MVVVVKKCQSNGEVPITMTWRESVTGINERGRGEERGALPRAVRVQVRREGGKNLSQRPEMHKQPHAIICHTCYIGISVKRYGTHTGDDGMIQSVLFLFWASHENNVIILYDIYIERGERGDGSGVVVAVPHAAGHGHWRHGAVQAGMRERRALLHTSQSRCQEIPA